MPFGILEDKVLQSTAVPGTGMTKDSYFIYIDTRN